MTTCDTLEGTRLVRHSRSHVEVLGVNLVVLWEVEIFLRRENSLWEIGEHKRMNPAKHAVWVELGTRGDVPRKRYSWIFFLSALGMSLVSVSDALSGLGYVIVLSMRLTLGGILTVVYVKTHLHDREFLS